MKTVWFVAIVLISIGGTLIFVSGSSTNDVVQMVRGIGILVLALWLRVGLKYER